VNAARLFFSKPENSIKKIYNRLSPTLICMVSTSDKPVVENAWIQSSYSQLIWDYRKWFL